MMNVSGHGIVAVAALLTATVAGCSEPEFGDCAVTCARDSDCPSGLTCNAGYCRADVEGSACPGQPDNPSQPDAGETVRDDAATAGDAAAPGGPVFSNGLGREHLEGVTASISVGSAQKLTINTDNGEMWLDDNLVRMSGAGVIQGIYFQEHPGGLGGIVGVMSLEVLGTVRVSGTGALHLVSAGNVRIAGIIDVSGGCDDGGVYCGGPGGGDGNIQARSGCGAGDNGQQGSGGGGGGHGQQGGDSCSSSGGPVCGMASLDPLIGGAAGGMAGDNAGEDPFAALGGGGGGAIQIASYTKVVIGTSGGTAAGIDAGGAGGQGPLVDPPFGGVLSGAGGGGAGGAILIEAPQVELLAGAVLAANGGSGAGIDCTFSQPGNSGQFSDEPAPGTCGGSDGGALEPPSSLDLCGNGGGGGAGRIRINTVSGSPDDLGATVSPAASFGTVEVIQ